MLSADMLDSLRIESFRGLCDLDFTPLSRINVLTGFNNSGKTSVLEALYVMLADHAQLVLYPQIFRSAQQQPNEQYEHFWKWLLPNGDVRKEADVSVITSDKKKLRMVLKKHPQQQNTLTIQYSDSSRGSVTVNVANGGIPAIATRAVPRMQFFSPRLGSPVVDAEAYNRVQLLSDGEDMLLELMKVVEPRLRKLRYAKVTKESLVYADVGLGTLIPAYQMGQAFCRMLTLYMQMLVNDADVLLIDEIENGLHSTVYTPVWEGIAALAQRQDLQIFVTTHSGECVQAASRAATRGQDHGFTHHRLEQFQGVTYVNSSTEVLGAGHSPKFAEIMQRSARADVDRSPATTPAT